MSTASDFASDVIIVMRLMNALADTPVGAINALAGTYLTTLGYTWEHLVNAETIANAEIERSVKLKDDTVIDGAVARVVGALVRPEAGDTRFGFTIWMAAIACLDGDLSEKERGFFSSLASDLDLRPSETSGLFNQGRQLATFLTNFAESFAAQLDEKDDDLPF